MRDFKMFGVRQVAAAAALTASFLCVKARAAVLDEVPSGAIGVLEIKNLEEMNAKVAKMAKTFGLDEMNPDMKDPLASLLEKAHMSKGLNKAGDAAMVIFAPEKDGKEEEPLALVPVSDFDAFVGNFEKAEDAKPAEGFTAVKDPENASHTMYIAHRGSYALLTDHVRKGLDKGELTLSKAVKKEIGEKDAVFFLNMPVVREKALPQLKAHRQEWIDQVDKALGEQDKLKAFTPVFDTLVKEALDAAEGFLNDTDAVVFSVELSDEGLIGSAMVSFTADSKAGQFVAEIKPTDTPLLAGLPAHKYFFFGGSSVDPKGIYPMFKKRSTRSSKI